MNQIEDLLQKLLQLTENKKIKWRTTVDPQAFLTVQGNQSIVIRKRTGGLPEPQYRLEVRNSGGSTIASLPSAEYHPTQQTPTPMSERRQRMAQLFDLASRSAVNDGLRDVIERLDKLIEDLEKV